VKPSTVKALLGFLLGFVFDKKDWEKSKNDLKNTQKHTLLANLLANFGCHKMKSMATLSLVLDKRRQKKDGTYPPLNCLLYWLFFLKRGYVFYSSNSE
jgi:hypothetical protein